MASLRRNGLAVGAIAGVLLFVPLLSGAQSSATTPAPTAGLAYVALGDSYAAGLGIAPRTGQPVAGCEQSAADYPHRIAKALDLQLSDQTCSGAVTANIAATRQRVGGMTTPVQASALGPDTRVVTLTIGGNDLGFASIVDSCIALTPHGPLLESSHLSCRASFVRNGVDTLATRITNVVAPRLAKTFAAIRKDAPQAKVFVVGYPTLMPDAAHTPAKGCFAGVVSGGFTAATLTDAFPYTDTDVAYLHAVQVRLDAATRVAAASAGFSYTSVLAGSEAHTPCGAVPWVNGITVTTNGLHVSVAAGALHPNSRGAGYLAASVIPTIRKAFPSPSPTPTPSAITPQGEPSELPWFLTVAVVVLVIAGGAVVVVRRRMAARRRDTSRSDQ